MIVVGLETREGDEEVMSSVAARATGTGRAGEDCILPDELKCVSEEVEFDCFNGDVFVGVFALTVEGERARGDSGLRNGDDRGELNAKGAGRSGVLACNCHVSRFLRVESSIQQEHLPLLLSCLASAVPRWRCEFS